MDHAHLVATNLLSMLEGESENALASLGSDELDALDNTVYDDVLDARVLALGVLSDQDRIDAIVRSLVTSNGAARSQVGKEVEGTTEGQVERDVALADGSLHIPSF